MFICTANVLHTVPAGAARPHGGAAAAGLHRAGEDRDRQALPRAEVARGHRACCRRTSRSPTTPCRPSSSATRARRASATSSARSQSICRKVARRVVAEGKAYVEAITPEKVTQFLGVPRFRPTTAEEKNEVGLATGLAWTEVGGEILVTEATLMPGRGRLTLTGKLGDVMQESAQAALSFVRSKTGEYGIDKDFHRRNDVHIHVPEGAIPKDGPSAGITMATALVSVLTGTPVRRDVAMTGRDHPARQGAAHRRREGEGAGGPPRRHHAHHPAEGQREGPRGHPAQRPRRAQASTSSRPWTRCCGSPWRRRCRGVRSPSAPSNRSRSTGRATSGSRIDFGTRALGIRDSAKTHAATRTGGRGFSLAATPTRWPRIRVVAAEFVTSAARRARPARRRPCRNWRSPAGRTSASRR